MVDKHAIELQGQTEDEPIKDPAQRDVGIPLTPEEDKRLLRRIDL
jgi:hypothetical protein